MLDPDSVGPMAVAFQYQPLPNNQKFFRLLELLPGSSEDTLRCRLQHTPLTAARPYEAVSYVWRVFHNSHDCATVLFGDKSLPITWNLQLALRYMRHETESRWLWADALCINQQDLKERTAQVQCMRAVYSNASKVIFWLGLVSFDVEAAFGFIDNVATMCPQTGDEVANDFENLDRLLAETPDSIWSVFGELLQVSLFKRIWVVQEFNLAVNGDLFACDSNQKLVKLGLERFKLAAFWIRKRRPVSIRQFQIPWGRLDPFLYLSFFPDNSIHRQTAHSEPPQPVHFVLRSVRELSCTVPHDRVYALLGHPALQTWCATGTLECAPISVDYTQHFSDLYLAVACRLLKESQPLLTLSLVEHNHATWEQFNSCAASSLPTWVPNWNNSWQNYFLPRESRVRYTAATGRAPSFRVDGRQLLIHGAVVDEIAWTSDIMTLETYEAGLVENQPESYRNVIRSIWKHLTESAMSEQNRPEFHSLVKLCWTLNAGGRILSEQTDRPEVTFDERLADLSAVLREIGVLLPGFDWQEEGYLSAGGDVARFLATTQPLCKGRRFFVTRKGLTCLGPSLTACGDELCIFYNSQVPFVIHELNTTERTHRLCGEAFAYGVMNGEALDLIEKAELVDTVFTLV